MDYEQTFQIVKVKVDAFLKQNGENPSKLKKELFIKELKHKHKVSTDSLRDLFPVPPEREVAFGQAEASKGQEFIDCQNLFEIFPEFLDKTDCVMAPWRAQCLLIFAGMTLLERVKFLGFFGETGDGKTKAAETLLKLLDSENTGARYIKAMEVSLKWLKYAGGPDGTALHRKLLFIDEVNPPKQGEDDSIQKLLRQLDNEDSSFAVYHSVEEISGKGRGASVTKLKLPIYVLITTITKPEGWDEQNRTRFVFVEFGLTGEEVEEINRRIARPTLPKAERRTYFRAFNYFLETLEKEGADEGFSEVVIPFMEELVPKADKYSSGADCRRFKLLADFIKASAILHQHHREDQVISQEPFIKVLVAQKEDHDNVKDLFEKIVPRSHNLVGEKHLLDFRTMFWHLVDAGDDGLNKNQISKQTGLSERRLDTALKRLASIGWLLRSQSKIAEKDRHLYYRLPEVCQAHAQLFSERNDARLDHLIGLLESSLQDSANTRDGADNE